MTYIFHDTKKQIAPCIYTKAKYALKEKKDKPNNVKKCSSGYWERVVKSCAIDFKIYDEKIIKEAIAKYSELALKNK